MYIAKEDLYLTEKLESKCADSKKEKKISSTSIRRGGTEQSPQRKGESALSWNTFKIKQKRFVSFIKHIQLPTINKSYLPSIPPIFSQRTVYMPRTAILAVWFSKNLYLLSKAPSPSHICHRHKKYLFMWLFKSFVSIIGRNKSRLSSVTHFSMTLYMQTTLAIGD